MSRWRIFVILLTLWVNVSAAEIVIVRNGKPAAEIILNEKPTRSAQMSALELQYVVRRITGATLPVVRKSSAEMLPIFVGGAKKGEFRGEQYKVSVTPSAIRLAGHDSEDYGRVSYEDFRTFPGTGYNSLTPRQTYNYHSTLYAVYDFLETLCGVRFYSFGEIGIALKKRGTLEVRPWERVYTPKADAFRYAGFVFRNKKSFPERDRKLLQLRWRMNTLFGETNHNTDSLVWRYWGAAKGMENLFIEKRPEYFIQGYDPMPAGDSKRLYPKDNPPPAQVCSTHPDVAEYFAREADEVFHGAAFKTPPLTGVRFRFIRKMEDKPFYYPIQEGDNSTWCKCARCQKLFPQIPEADRHSYIHFDFINRIAEKAKKRNPELNISTLAYNMALKHPDSSILELNPGIAVQMCLGVHSWMHPAVYERQHGAYREWVENEIKNRPLFVWTYMLSPESEAYAYKYKNFFPMLYPWKAAGIYKEFMRDGIRGVFHELSGRYNQLEGYIAMRTAFDPDYDTDVLIDEYFRLYYEESAVPMKNFFREVEKIIWDHKNYPAKEVASLIGKNRSSSTAMGIHTQSVNWALGTPERMKTLQKLLNEANRLARTAEVKIRIATFMEDIWRNAVRGREAYEKRLNLEKNPPPGVTAAYFPSIGNDTEKLVHINWNDVRPTSPWYDLKNGKPLTEAESPQIRIGCDRKYLFLHFRERGEPALKNQDAGFWRNNVEIFYGADNGYPFDHLVIGTDGKWEAYRHIFHDGAAGLEKINIPELRIDNRLDGDGWSWTLALPLAGSCFETLPVSRINFIRTRGKDTAPLAWSYLDPADYAGGAFRMGYLHLPRECDKETLRLDGDFSKFGKNGELADWTQNAPPSSKGKYYTAGGGGVTLECKSDKVQLMAPFFPIRHGDRLIFEFTVSGSGKGAVGAYFYTSFNSRLNYRWLTMIQREIQANGAPKIQRIVVNTGELKPSHRDILGFRPFLLAEKGTRISFSDVRIIRDPAL